MSTTATAVSGEAARNTAGSGQAGALEWLREALRWAIEHETGVFAAELAAGAAPASMDAGADAGTTATTAGAGVGAGAGTGDATVREPSASKDITFSVATPDDIASIVDMVTELAVFEKEPEAVKTTPESYLRDGFGPSESWVAVIGKVGTDAVSFALLFPTFSTWVGRCLYLEDLYVRPAWRRKGVGARVLRILAAATQHSGCKRLTWQVLDWNVKAISVYDRLGAKHLDTWFTYRLSGEALTALAQVEE